MRAPSQEPVKPPAQLPPMKIGSVDVEVFSRNLARLVEEGGRALAAYLKPREEGRDDSELAEEVDRSGQDARPGRGILAGRPAARRRTAEPAGQGLSRSVGFRGEAACRRGSPACGRARHRATSASPIRNGRRTSSSTFSSRPICSPRAGPIQLVSDAADLNPHTRQKAEFYVRQITNALSPTNFVLTNPELLRETFTSQCRQPGSRHAHAGRGHRSRRRRPENPAVGCLDVRGRPQPRRHARQGHLPERADAAHPIRARRPKPCSSGRC